MTMARVMERGDGTMDGDGHSAKAFAWNAHEDDADEAPPAFDPAAVLRAIDAEEDEDRPAPHAARPAASDADLGAALRAAFAYEDAPGEADEDAALASDADDEAGWDDAPEAETDAAEEDDAWEDELALSDAHDDDWSDEDEHPGPFAADAAETQEPEADDAPEARHEPEADDEPEAHDAPEPSGAAASFLPMSALDGPGRKPRIALMGEFSAGKSTLSNLLIGSAPLPMKVTATQLPPVWISWGDGAPYREDLDGETHPIDIARLSDIDPSETRVIRIFAKSHVLEMCDIIDMPGISDPNMDPDVWERVIGRADAVIWCTHATQAWRQSEASVWESLDPALHARSLLLVTRFDKLHAESDRVRVMRRVERETEGLFAAQLPISLTDALSAGDDEELLAKSGAAAFRDRLVEILDRLSDDLGTDMEDRQARARTADTLSRDGMVARIEGGRPVRVATPSRILPRRVRPVSEGQPQRGEHGLEP
jgi:hypothetical protein